MNLSPNTMGSGKPVVVKGRYSSYELQGVLGKGGSAVVYRATDLATLQTVAAKKITALDDDAMHQWRTEVETLMTLKDVDGSHHVIRYLDHLVHDKTIVIVEEYAANGSLQAHLRQKGGIGFEERDVVRLVYQITSGLAFIHSKDIVHRDLKCANALVCDDGQVKLSDFGLSAADPKRLAEEAAKAAPANDGLDGEDRDGAPAAAGTAAASHPSGPGEEGTNPVMGSVYWMAPETVRGQDANPSSDIWSLGCLCVELLTGRPPFFDRPPASALYHIAACKEPVPLPDVPLSEDGRAFLQSCLQPDPSRRPTAKQLLQSPWFSDVRVELRLEALVAQAVKLEEGQGPLPHTGATPSTTPRHAAAGHRGDASARRVSAASSSAAANDAAVPATMEATDSLKQWVETNLFTGAPERKAAWTQEYIPKLVLALPLLTPAEVHDSIRAFAFAASEMGSGFTDPLGESSFWDYTGFTLSDEMPLHAVSIFEACGKHQSPSVRVFAPTCPRALAVLLTSSREGVAARCVEVLHHLFCSSPPPPTVTIVVSGEGTEGGESARQKTLNRVELARRRLVTDGGLLALRSYAETECQAAFMRDGPPSIGWASMDRIFQVLLSASNTERAESLLWGSGLNVPPVSEAHLRSSPTPALGNDAGSSPRLAEADAEGGVEKSGGAAVANGTRRISMPPLTQAARSGSHGPASPAAGHDKERRSSSARTPAMGPLTSASDARTNAGGDDAEGQDGRGKAGAATSMESVLNAAPAPTVRWYLAIQYAASSTVAPSAAEFLVTLVDRLAQASRQSDATPPPPPLSAQQQQQQQSGRSQHASGTPSPQHARADTANPAAATGIDYSTSDDEESTGPPERALPPPATYSYLEKAGVGLASALLELACCQTLSAGKRMAAVQRLPVLQSCSARAAAYLADECCAIPLYAYLMERPPNPAVGGRREVLQTLLAVTEHDPRVQQAGTASPLLAPALGCTLCALAQRRQERTQQSQQQQPQATSENTKDEDTAMELSLCLRLALRLRGSAATAESIAMQAVAAALAQHRESILDALHAYAEDAATPAEQGQLCRELLRMAVKAKAAAEATKTTTPQPGTGLAVGTEAAETAAAKEAVVAGG